MGTGAVYVTLSGLKEHSTVLTNVETFFYFLNIALFTLNTTTLLLQFIREFSFVSWCLFGSHIVHVQCTRSKLSV